MSLSPLDPDTSTFHVIVGDAQISLGQFDAAIDEYRKAVDVGPGQFFVCTNLAAAYAHAGKMDEAKSALAEARHLNPAITIKWMKEPGRVRRPAQGGAAGGVTETRNLVAILARNLRPV